MHYSECERFLSSPRLDKYKAACNGNQRKALRKINILRNRIAHHEPICFDEFGKISTAMVVKRYALIKDLLQWIGCNPRELLYGIDNVQKEINYINRLASTYSPKSK
jgi:hypothetical protein